MQTANDLCPGYLPDKHAHSGLCCCGLYWTSEMPPHDARRRPVALDRVLRRAVERAEAESARRANVAALRRNGVEAPLPPSLRLRGWW